MGKGIYDDWKAKRNVRKFLGYSHQIANQSIVADNINNEKKKDSIVYNFDENNFNKGKLWFNEGLSLEEAPDNLKNNVSFVAGYQKAERVKSANELSFKTGIDFYDRGVPFEEIPKIYKNNEFFMNGYNSKSNKTLGK